MGGGSPTPTTSTTIQKSEPPAYVQPFIEEMLGGASERYGSDQPQYFPGSTVVPFSPETELALGAGAQRAIGGSPISQAGNQEYLKTVQGQYLDPSTNPFLRQTQQAAIQPAVEAFNEQMLPGITSAFSAAGRYGSPAMGQQVEQKARDAMRGISESTSRLAYQNYADERGRQAGFTQQAPQFAQGDYLDLERLAGIGGQQEAKSAERLADEVNRFNFGQNIEGQKLGEYANLIGQGTFGGTSTGQSTIPYYQNNLMGGLGAALGAGGLGLRAAGK